MTAQQLWDSLASRIDALSLRERGMILGAVLAAMYVAWDLSVLSPLARREAQTNLVLQGLNEEAQVGDSAANSMGELGARIQNARNRENEARQELKRLDGELSASTTGLIPPERMANVLRDVLNRQQGLKLISLAATQSVPLLPPAPGAVGSAAIAQGPFVHSFELVLAGDYRSVLEYLRALESLRWKIYWQQVDLRTEQYPSNRVRIVVSTLSMDNRSVGT